MTALALSTAIREVIRGELGEVRTVPEGDFAEGAFDGLEDRARQRRAFEKTRVDVVLRPPARTTAAGSPDASEEIIRYDVDLVFTHNTKTKIEEEARHCARAEVADDVTRVRRALSRSGQMLATAAGEPTGLVSGMLVAEVAPVTVREDWDKKIIVTQQRMQGWVQEEQPVGLGPIVSIDQLGPVLHLEGDVGVTADDAGLVETWAASGSRATRLSNFAFDADPVVSSFAGLPSVRFGTRQPDAPPFEFLSSALPPQNVVELLGGDVYSIYGAFLLHAQTERTFNAARPEDCALLWHELGLSWGIGLVDDGLFAYQTDDDGASFGATPRIPIELGAHLFRVRYNAGVLSLQVDEQRIESVQVGRIQTSLAGLIGPGAFEVSVPAEAQQPEVAQVSWGTFALFDRVLTRREQTGLYDLIDGRWTVRARE